MAVDQVEILTHQKSQQAETHPRDVKKVLDSLPIQVERRVHQRPVKNSALLNSMIEGEASLEPEGPFTQTFLSVVTGVAYAVAVGVAVALMGSVIVSSLEVFV